MSNTETAAEAISGIAQEISAVQSAVANFDRISHGLHEIEKAYPADAICDAIGTTRYMDPPDGGDVPIAEQVRRMSADAARYLWLRNDALRAAMAQQGEPVAWMESPHGAIRANPAHRWSAPQSVAWSIPLYAAPQPAPVAQQDGPTHDVIAEVIGCFDAAYAEGLNEALANTSDLTLKDLVERRVLHALYAAQGVSTMQPAPVAHADDIAVDAFAAAMKAKLAEARGKGRSGWETCRPEVLSEMLRDHVEKGDTRDVANFCMFLWSLGARIALPLPGSETFDRWVNAGMGLTSATAAPVAPMLAEPTDEQLDAVIVEQWGRHSIGLLPAHRAFARAVLALRPVAQPLTDEHRDAVLLEVIRHLNTNTYNLTKSEGISEVQALRAHKIGGAEC